MVQSLEAIKGGEGSVRVGTAGTISSLMTRELQSMNTASQKISSSFFSKPQTGPVTPIILKAKKSSDEASSSGLKSYKKSPEFSRKSEGFSKSTHRIPMLNIDNIFLDRIPSREKIEKKGSNIVEVVDTRCGNSDRPQKSPHNKQVEEARLFRALREHLSKPANSSHLFSGSCS